MSSMFTVPITQLEFWNESQVRSKDAESVSLAINRVEIDSGEILSLST
jgi:hypothetical protein